MAGTSSMRLLVVEDNRVLSTLVKKALERISTDVTFVIARDGKEGLDLARRQPPDLVVLDLLMPEYDGFFFLDGQAKDAALQDIPVLLHTAVKEAELTERIANYPAVKGYIPKPVSPTDLIAKMAGFLRSSSAE